MFSLNVLNSIQAKYIHTISDVTTVKEMLGRREGQKYPSPGNNRGDGVRINIILHSGWDCVQKAVKAPSPPFQCICNCARLSLSLSLSLSLCVAVRNPERTSLCASVRMFKSEREMDREKIGSSVLHDHVDSCAYVCGCVGVWVCGWLKSPVASRARYCMQSSV
jgi:hypothetical protein